MSNITDQIKEAYLEVEKEGKKWLKLVQSEKDHDLNALYTIRMNGTTYVKREIEYLYGRQQLKELLK